jgi:hypothetical protein
VLRDKVLGNLTSYPPDSFRNAFQPAVSASVVCASRRAGIAINAATAIAVNNFIYAPILGGMYDVSKKIDDQFTQTTIEKCVSE